MRTAISEAKRQLLSGRTEKMTDTIIALAIGIFIGAQIGFFTFALCAMQERED